MFEDRDTKAVRQEMEQDLKQLGTILVNVANIVKGLIFVNSSAGEFFLREGFGIRYLICSAFLTALSMGAFQYAWCSLFFQPYSEAFGIFGVVYGFAWLYHVIAWFRRKEMLHDQSCGMPSGVWVGWFYPRFFGPSGLLYFAEPGLCIVAALLVGVFSSMLGTWLLLVAMCLLCKALILGAELRANIQNAINRELEAQQMQEAVSGAKDKTKEKSPPWVVGGSNKQP